MELSGMAFINEVIQTILYTALVDAKPVSLLLIGPSGGGKSITLLRWRADWIHHTNDITSIGLTDIVNNDHAQKLHYIIIPDFNVPLSHKSAVTNLTVSNMLSLMSEGVVRIDDGRVKKETTHAPIGFISAVTPDMYISQYKKWKALGLLRRFLILNYDYDIATRMEGNGLIRAGKITTQNLAPVNLQIDFKKGLRHVSLDTDRANQIQEIALTLAGYLGYRVVREYKTGKIKWMPDAPALEFAPHLVMQTIAKANAIRNKRGKVTPKDIEFLTKLLRFTNPSRAELI